MSEPIEYKGVVDFGADIPDPFNETTTVEALIRMLSVFDPALPVFIGGDIISQVQEALCRQVCLSPEGVSRFRDYDLDASARICVVLS